jgi:SAM-dependent methyltransferase
MSNLYTNLSTVYEAMYQSFIDYEAEYVFYSDIMFSYHCKSVVEIGCGSGNLASRFVNNGFDYIGLDLSDDMLKMAKIKTASGVFIKADMRQFNLEAKLDACIITGRTISYLITNNDILDCFKSINNNLKSKAIVCFDCINANKFIPHINPTKKVIHKANFKNKSYQRDSIWKVNLANNFCFDWASVYYEKAANDKLVKIGEDNSTVRTFTIEEIVLFLTITGFNALEIIERPSYAFDTFVIVAQKNN